MRKWFKRHHKLLIILSTIIAIGTVVYVTQVIIEDFHEGEKYLEDKKDSQKQQDKKEMIKMAEDHKEEIEKSVKYDDHHHRIRSVTIEYSKIRPNPMAGIIVPGYVNGDKTLSFEVGVYYTYEEDKGQSSYHEKLNIDVGGMRSKLYDFLTEGDNK